MEEYIPPLKILSKWTKSENQNLKKDDLVWIINDQAKRCGYKMGLVLEVYLGSDRIVRSALIKSRDGSVLKRPCVKLAPVFNCLQNEKNASDVGAS